ncbi:type II secretion system F family protein [Phototrophicus methaneseepsis]|uniref:Type II secretion system F family protein n=1 Tax=Phototrophicus methaneseepsis TaxID=2710758 RepID=A0A7S8E571_9CHLR|nr:type II secretion system F family protein [Phototrophicus methaneseepsis]QPC80586.1 type II secretion system F family protein [Phototrophicus methaneseepsis]
MLGPEQILILGVAGAIAIGIIIFGAVTSRREDLVEARLGQIENDLDEFPDFAPGESDEDSSALDEGRKLLEPINNYLVERRFGKNARQKLARADIKLTVAEYAVARVASVAAGFAIGFLGWSSISIALIGAAIGFFLPVIYVGRAVNKRLITFENQLPDTLGLWVNAIRSGYSVLQAMEAIAQDAPEPTQTEFQRVVQEVQIGISMPDALDHMLQRLDSPDLDLVITAVNIQREVGGNLAEILEVIAGTIRERIKLKGEIRVLTSQGRITGYAISMLPIGVALLLMAINEQYMNRMFENRECGWPMIGLGLALIGMGAAAIQKIVDIEI